MKGLSLGKKIVFIALALFVIAVGVVKSPSSLHYVNAQVETGDGFVFDNGIIMGYNGTNTRVTVPSTINGQAVREISAAFMFNTTLREVIISEGITAVTNNAFYSCPNLESITIPSTVTTITPGSLAAGFNFESIILSELNTSFVLTENILYNADQTEIIHHIVTGTSPVILETVTTIHELAFAYSYNISAINIPATVETIGTGAFSYCSNLTSITVDELNPNYTSISDVLFTKDEITLHTYPAFKADTEYTIPIDTEVLLSYSFSGCQKLTDVNILDNVNTLSGAFVDSSSLVNVNVIADNLDFSSLEGVLLSKDAATLIYYPTGRVASSYIVPAGVTTIGETSFFMHPHIQSVTLQSEVTTIEPLVFFMCDSITKVIVPESVVNFETFALSGAKNLNIWGYPLTKAEDYARLWNIPFVAIGSNSQWAYTDNGDGTCDITGYLGTAADVLVPSVIDNLWVDEISYTTFLGGSNIEYIYIYESVKTIEASADAAGSVYIFEDCANLREIYLPSSLQKLQTYTAPYKPFKGCTSLVNIVVYGDSASFYDKDGVLFSSTHTLITYPSGRTSQSYTIPSTTKGISYTAFNNSYLKTVTVPGSVASLEYRGEDTFKNNIETVYLNNGVLEVQDVFSDVNPMEIHFPASVNTVSGFEYEAPHTFYAFENSAPHLYAVENNIPYVVLCQIDFESNGGSAVDSLVVTAGSKLSEPEAPTKDKNVFMGWYTDSEFKDKWSFAEDIVLGSMTLYAKWVEGYPIIYHMNGGVNNSKNPDYYVSGHEMYLQDPTKTNYTFDGWYTDSSCALKYKFEYIAKDTKGTLELWADWWVMKLPDNDDYDNSGGGSSGPAYADERRPELSQDKFPDEIAYMRQGQEITVTGKIYIQYANVEEISVMYSGKTDKLYKYQEGETRLSKFDYSHTFEVGEINYAVSDKYLITVRLSSGEFYQHEIPIHKYNIITEVLNAPKNDIYMNSDKTYELRSMAIANDSFDIIDAAYENLTPEICSIDGNILQPLAAGTAQIESKITLNDGSIFEYTTEFRVIGKTESVPSELESAFVCPCYGEFCTGLPEEGIDPALLQLIETIRSQSESSIYIISGYRCPEYNQSIDGEEESEHTHGTAADLWSDELTIDELYTLCDELNQNGGVGKYLDYIHIDTRGVYIRWEE